MVNRTRPIKCKCINGPPPIATSPCDAAVNRKSATKALIGIVIEQNSVIIITNMLKRGLNTENLASPFV